MILFVFSYLNQVWIGEHEYIPDKIFTDFFINDISRCVNKIFIKNFYNQYWELTIYKTLLSKIYINN